MTECNLVVLFGFHDQMFTNVKVIFYKVNFQQSAAKAIISMFLPNIVSKEKPWATQKVTLAKFLTVIDRC